MHRGLSAMSVSRNGEYSLVGGARPALFSHDDDRYADTSLTDSPSDDEGGDSNWESSTPNWRSRISAGADQRAPISGTPQDLSGQRRGTSTISTGAAISGTLRSEDPLYIEGTFDGEIFASGNVTIAVGASVNARVQAIRVTVAGSFKGSVACTDRFEALETGTIEARIFAPTLIIHDGAVINGAFEMRIEDDETLENDDDETVDQE